MIEHKASSSSFFSRQNKKNREAKEKTEAWIDFLT